MKRREFIKLSAIAALMLTLDPDKIFANESGNEDKVFVLIELEGGNDGLNTVIPYTDETYYDLRGSLAVEKEKVLPLNDSLGFHPKLEKLKNIWDENELAVVLGVGYENPNRSHFRSKDIWNTASDSEEYLTEGWIGRLLWEHPFGEGFFSDTVTMGKDDTKPFDHEGMKNIVLDSPEKFVKKAGSVEYIEKSSKEEMLSYVIYTQNELHDTVEVLKEKIDNPVEIETKFPNSKLGTHFKDIAFLLKNGIKAPVFKAALGGFDTHSNQASTHERLLEELSEALSSFREALIEIGYWDKTLIMTYSEFGRRPAKNGSNGTDHGTAAPHFILGGKVKGGFYSKQPSLSDLDSNGDLKYTVDYRSLYSSVVKKWWKIEGSFLDKYPAIECIKL